MFVVVFGVSGSGKTTVGKKLAERLNGAFFDADEFHPPANVAKMHAGQPLTDADRAPWLDRLAELIATQLAAHQPAVLACSALKRAYRERLRPADPALRPQLQFVYLALTKEMAFERVSTREGHFMPATLVDSQFATLEEPLPGEAIRVDAGEPVDTIADHALERIVAWNQKRVS